MAYFLTRRTHSTYSVSVWYANILTDPNTKSCVACAQFSDGLFVCDDLEDINVKSQEILKIIFNASYDKHLPPDPKGVTVSIELALQTFYDISETSASFTADVLMR